MLSAMSTPNAMAGSNTEARELKIQLPSFALMQPESLCVSLEVAGLHRAQRAIDDCRSLYPPTLLPQLSCDGLVLEDLVVVAELKRRVAGTRRLIFKGDRQVGDHHRLVSHMTHHNVRAESCAGVFRNRLVETQLRPRLTAFNSVSDLGTHLLKCFVVTLADGIHIWCAMV